MLSHLVFLFPGANHICSVSARWRHGCVVRYVRHAPPHPAPSSVLSVPAQCNGGLLVGWGAELIPTVQGCLPWLMVLRGAPMGGVTLPVPSGPLL